MVIPLIVLAAAAAAPLSEESCSVILTLDEGKIDYVKVDGLKVLGRNPSKPLNIAPDEADVAAIKGIMCWRSEVRFAKNDYLAALQYPLYIKSDHQDESQNRTAVLEYTTAGFRVRLLNGPAWSAEMEDEVRKMVAHYNKAAAQVVAPPQ